MKIDRAEVERLANSAALAMVERRENEADKNVVTDATTMAALCRLALEVMDAPVAYVPAGRAMADLIPASLAGQRVRLVRVGEE